jgi:hypothetical protein
LEIMDFDHNASEIFPAWGQRLKERGEIALFRSLFIVATIKGYHVYFRSPACEGNKKLAASESGEVLIETRGEGGYVLTPNQNEDRYDVIYGSVQTIPTLTAGQRSVLLDTAREFNQKFREVCGSQEHLGKGRPGDDYNARMGWPDLLEADGWSLIGDRNGVTQWIRPGKSVGVSATTGYTGDSEDGPDLLYVFTSNAPPLEPDTAYSRFAYYAVVHCGGDYSVAARKLLADGFGEQSAEGVSGGSQLATLLAIGTGQTLFRGTDGQGYAKIDEYCYPIDGELYLHWLEERFTEETGKVPGESPLRDAARKLARRTRLSEAAVPVFMRVGYHEGAVYLDLGGARFIKVTPEGWTQEADVGCHFLRPRVTLPTPTRDVSSDIWDRFGKYINAGAEGSWILAVHWLIGCLNPFGTYPMLLIQGEGGSAKSHGQRILRRTIDPAPSAQLGYPKTVENVMIQALHNYILAYDNLSGVSNDVSDALCTVASGTGFATRQLYTNSELHEFTVKRPIILNSIDAIAHRADLASRSISLDFPRITKYIPEQLVDQATMDMHPEVLGAMLNAASAALKNLSSITDIPVESRLTDWLAWSQAALSALPWGEADLAAALEANKKRVMGALMASDPVGLAVYSFMQEREEWEGEPQQLYDALDSHVPSRTLHSRDWPQTLVHFGRSLHRIAPVLREYGIRFEQLRFSDRRVYHFRRAQ